MFFLSLPCISFLLSQIDGQCHILLSSPDSLWSSLIWFLSSLVYGDETYKTRFWWLNGPPKYEQIIQLSLGQNDTVLSWAVFIVNSNFRAVPSLFSACAVRVLFLILHGGHWYLHFLGSWNFRKIRNHLIEFFLGLVEDTEASKFTFNSTR